MKGTDILIMGNGFDLWCRLNSRYSDFARKRKEMYSQFYTELNNYLMEGFNINRSSNKLKLHFIPGRINAVIQKIDHNLNLWEIYFTLKNFDSKNELLWKNIEKDIVEFFKVTTFRNMSVKNLYNDLCRETEITDESNRLIPNGEFLRYSLYLLVYALMLNSDNFDVLGYNLSGKIFDLSLKNRDEDGFGRYMLNELHRFESSFCVFLREQVNTNEIYDLKVERLLSIITRSTKFVENTQMQNTPKIYYLSFNYTLPKAKQLNKLGANVHGFIGDIGETSEARIIIGIDQEQTSESNKYELLFTKTYRKLFHKENVASQPLPPKADARRIIFFGHSLGDADYSYFRSIFDYYDIESSAIEVVFYYSVFDVAKREEISQNQFRDVYNLLKDYSSKTNKNSGKNLVHRMLLEHRLKIIEVEES